ncbi:hypothetical protein SAMN05443667_10870 [Flavobacterium gillisiae]|uniref:DUF3575 domain-containing protein n=1 Tax=Flavobacterium gillisiae TaxID=150146 RepID=A0A1H4DRP8_9FLAO|nr:hypothetical protein [Flavobacterium gillisiae]SEA75179.1 hypothetical protein SAMN05443667_10870 [Flavobacterium gillisiae]
MKKILLTLTVILFNFFIASSQTNTATSIDSLSINNELIIPKKNNVKISLTSLVFKNFQFQYERSLTKRIGFVLGYSFIPKGSVPFKSQINDLASSDPDTQNMFTNAELGYTAITPEVRFYLGKGYGKGFYIAPFYRHLQYDITGVNFTYTTDLGGQADIDMGGKLSANTFGLQFGAQFNLGKNLILDWWIIGPHYGTSKGDFVGVTDGTLSTFEQAELQKELDKIELPLSDVNAKANANGATLNISGPWGGIRSGLSLGYRF